MTEKCTIDFAWFLLRFDDLALVTGHAKNRDSLKNLTGQAEAMFKHLIEVNPDKDALDRTFKTLSHKCHRFPNVNQILEVYESEARVAIKPQETKRRGCSKCSTGWVHYLTGRTTKNGRPEKASAPCYHCNKGESGPWPYLIQDHDRIYLAATRIGDHQWRAIVPAGQRPELTSLNPLRTSSSLEASHRDGPTLCPDGADLRQSFNQMTKIMEVA